MKSLLSAYLKDIARTTARGDAREESYYPALKALLEAFPRGADAPPLAVTVLPKKTEAGNPDFRVWDGEHRVIGYIEAKKPNTNLDRIEESEQLRRYRATFPNLILTDFYEFRLYRDGVLVERVQIARPFVARDLKTRPPLENIAEFERLMARFLAFSLPRSPDAETLAVELAKRTRFLRDQVIAAELHDKDGDIHGFYTAFQEYLIAGLTEKQFADLYAQTITYGLFAARTRAGEKFNRKLAFDYIPPTVGILRDVFRFISLGNLPPQLEVTVDDIAAVLHAADTAAILDAYYRQHKGDDPIVHFYETFLAAYDPETRERRGVYYTPEPVVRYIVRGVHHLLQTRFDFADGLADPRVTLLDPAAGTLTFPAEAIRLAAATYREKYGEGGLAGFLHREILRHFFAFELMMAPYAIAHMKAGFLFESLGAPLGEDERFQLYLTNTLEMEDIAQVHIPGLRSLSEESRLAGHIKKEEPVLVILGNPPYSGISANQNEWTEKLLKTDLDGAQSYYTVDGQPLGERNPKWLQDDYVKFLRFAQWKIQKAGRGIVAMITNHGYLDNPTFRGMRQSLLKTFDEIFVLDLHGNSLKREKAPDGGPDENVFDIRQGVAIAFFVKTSASARAARVFHADLYGTREHKYAWLEGHTLDTAGYQPIAPRSPYYFFIPRKTGSIQYYLDWPQITEIFPLYGAGMTTARDGFVIDFDRHVLLNRIRAFKHSDLDDDALHLAFGIRKKKGWDIRKAWQQLQQIDDADLDAYIKPVLYRPFDVRHIFYHDAVVWRTVKRVMRHMLAGENLGLIVPRRVEHVGSWQHAFVTKHMTEHVAVSLKTIDYHFPLYLYPDPEQPDMFAQEKRANINPQVWGWLVETYPTPIPSPLAGRGVRGGVSSLSPSTGRGERGGVGVWQTPPALWEKLKPLAREMRKHPTPAEEALWQRLRRRQLGVKFRRQHPIGPFIVDFYCAEAALVVEVDGPIHQYTAEEDAIRQEFLEAQGLRVLRFTNAEVENDIEGVLNRIRTALQSTPRRELTPEDLLAYIYAVFYTPTYRRKYAEFLRIDFPRVPFPQDAAAFWRMAALGHRLVALHLLQSPELDPPVVKFHGIGDNTIQRPRYDAAKGRVYINAQKYFEGITPEMWNYQIGGYKVLQKYLKDRKGRELRGPRRYIRIATAIARTLEIQEELDVAYAAVEKAAAPPPAPPR